MKKLEKLPPKAPSKDPVKTPEKKGGISTPGAGRTVTGSDLIKSWSGLSGEERRGEDYARDKWIILFKHFRLIN